MIRIDERFNWARVVVGGVFAGIAMNVIGFIAAIPQLNPSYEFLLDIKFLQPVPRHPALEIKVAGVILLGILLGWLYAVARHRLGPGPRTALTVVSSPVSLQRCRRHSSSPPGIPSPN